MCVLVAQSCLTLCDPHVLAHQAPLSMGFSTQEYWSGLPCPSPGDLPALSPITLGESKIQNHPKDTSEWVVLLLSLWCF